MSIIGNQIWYLLPHRRKRKAKQDSTMWGFVDAVGEVLDTLKLAILTARLQRYFLVRAKEETEDYYTSDERTLDLEAHGRDRGLMRLPDETDDELLARISTLPYRNGFLGTKTGMKYLIEDWFGLQINTIVEFYADDMLWIVLSEREHGLEAEINLSHVFNAEDQITWDAYRQNRINSCEDVSEAFHFVINISNPGSIEFDPDIVTELVNAQKPAHTRSILIFME